MKLHRNAVVLPLLASLALLATACDSSDEGGEAGSDPVAESTAGDL